MFCPVCHLARLVTSAFIGDLIEESPMARKTRKSTDINSGTGLPRRLHAPRELRAVGAVTTANHRYVPSIRLSGAWLERVGFRRGVEYLVVADVPNQILLVLTEP